MKKRIIYSLGILLFLLSSCDELVDYYIGMNQQPDFSREADTDEFNIEAPGVEAGLFGVQFVARNSVEDVEGAGGEDEALEVAVVGSVPGGSVHAPVIGFPTESGGGAGAGRCRARPHPHPLRTRRGPASPAARHDHRVRGGGKSRGVTQRTKRS